MHFLGEDIAHADLQLSLTPVEPGLIGFVDNSSLLDFSRTVPKSD